MVQSSDRSKKNDVMPQRPASFDLEDKEASCVLDENEFGYIAVLKKVRKA
jgi:hypothetical protein